MFFLPFYNSSPEFIFWITFRNNDYGDGHFYENVSVV